MRFFILIIFLLGSGLCHANNILADCIQNALKESIAIIEQKGLSIHRSIGRDSLDERYQNLIKLPHKYFIDDYSYYVSVGGHISFDTKYTYITNQVRKKIEQNFNNITFTFDSIAVRGALNNIKVNGYVNYYDKETPPTDLFEMLDISDVYLRGNKLSVVIGYWIMDDKVRVMRSPVYMGFTYTLSENGEWKQNDSIWTRNENVAYQTHLDISHDLSNDNNFNELECMVPFAYSKFNSLKEQLGIEPNTPTCEYETNGLSILLDENSNSELCIPDEIIPDDKEYWFTDTIMYQDINLTPYRDAEFLYDYRISKIPSRYIDKMECVSDTSNLFHGFVAGSPNIDIKTDSLKISFDYYKMQPLSCDTATGAKSGAKKPWDYDKLIIVPILTYNCVFRYNQDLKKWCFMNDSVEHARKSKIFIEKSVQPLLNRISREYMLNEAH